MKILLNPDYSHLSPFVENIDKEFEKGETIYKGRNLIRVCNYKGIQLNVKRYCKPHIFQRFIYSFFRAPKGLRAYKYPNILQQADIPTPTPIAYIEKKEHALIGECYFISLQSPYRHTLREFAETKEFSLVETNVLREFAKMTAKMHEHNILHLDYSPGNILFDFKGNKPVFTIVDLNRMRFGKVNQKRGCKNFARLWGQKEMYYILSDAYADARKYDQKETLQLMLKARYKFWKKFIHKHGPRFTFEP